MHKLTAVVLLAIVIATGCEAPPAAPTPTATDAPQPSATTTTDPPTVADPSQPRRAQPLPLVPSPTAKVVYGKTIKERYYAKVVRIVDGDTLVILTNTKTPEQIKVRLEGIDTPEKGQPFGNRAKQKLADLTFGKTAEVAVTGSDRYGRTLAYITADYTNANAALVEAGMAWHYVKYNKDEELAALQAMAKEAGVGLWADANPVAPWDWRKKK